ncbi:hypothetical protein WN944_028991 [Citrus x changshan-huyou]|uniref:Uncharacterized protein n=1 Tax=Citrus x changshan-huyou TaxID=2935761 RepID=A0AAP0Q9H6_9ROSI
MEGSCFNENRMESTSSPGKNGRTPSLEGARRMYDHDEHEHGLPFEPEPQGGLEWASTVRGTFKSVESLNPPKR